MSPTVLLLSLCGNPTAHFELSAKEIRREVSRSIPFMERTKATIFREFLASDLTVKDMQTRLGKRRPSDIYKMMLTFTKKELKTGFFLDQITDALGADFIVKMEPVNSQHGLQICAFLDWIEGDTDTLTDEALSAFVHYMSRPDLKWPNDVGREWARSKLASQTETL